MNRLGEKSFRVGIDVGGTFTDVVIIDNSTLTIVGQLKVPTTHSAKEGVAGGIIEALTRALTTFGIPADQISFIGHSTTQATNALLEGDVAKVGVVGIGSGLEAWKARIDTDVPPTELAEGKALRIDHEFLVSGSSTEVVKTVVHRLKDKGVEVVVASEAFGVDDPSGELAISQEARNAGMLATAGHEVSGLYGLRTRTRTAAINAAILPKMVHTALMTERCVKQSGISSPLMIMRSDGGVMSVDEVNRRPILTMLSGPAAGVAGALMFERVSNGIFIEVGGTSADISVIKDGRPQIKAARLGGHRTFLNTLDVRTIAIAGGSLIREKGGRLVDVGSRSAHIAGLPYACFQDHTLFNGATLVHLQPTEGDPNDYVAVECRNGERFALTPTCASNLLNLIPKDAFAYATKQAAEAAFIPLAERLGLSVEETARQILEISTRKLFVQISDLITEYGLDTETVELVGGGGGAAALIPFAGDRYGFAWRLARKAEVISTIGVALAMVKDSIERNIVDPSPEDILAIRKEAIDAVCKNGAVMESVDVTVEVDAKRNLVRATACGTTEIVTSEAGAVVESPLVAAGRALKVSEKQIREVIGNDEYKLFETIKEESYGFVFRRRRTVSCVVDKHGVVRLQRGRCEVIESSVEGIEDAVDDLISQLTDFGDAGRSLPEIHIISGHRLISLTGLADAEQTKALARVEVGRDISSGRLIVIGCKTV